MEALEEFFFGDRKGGLDHVGKVAAQVGLFGIAEAFIFPLQLGSEMLFAEDAQKLWRGRLGVCAHRVEQAAEGVLIERADGRPALPASCRR
jgi:hypothetical protein